MINNNIFNVSVIIPVYNAEKYLQKAVDSALQLKEVKEVILIEDNSPDNALEVCNHLVNEDSRVKLFIHPNGENRGAGASRNLGIKMATCQFIAFLDADDWYLPNRFAAEKVLFKNKEVDGVYGATGFYYQERNTFDLEKLTTISENIQSNNLLFEALKANGGRFTTDAITIRKSLLNETGLFDVNLKLHQDSELFSKLIYFGNLVAGIVDKPIAYRRVHNENRITNRNRKTALMYNTKMLANFVNYKNVDKQVFRILFISYIITKTEFNSNLLRLFLILREIIKQPKLILLLLKGS